MFKIKIFKTIWAGELPSTEGTVFENLKYITETYPDSVSLEYEMEIPFAPYPGLKINNDPDGHCFRSGEIKEVTWFNSDNLFGCWVEDSQPYSSRGYDYTYEWLIDEALKDGWKVIE